MRRLFEGSKIRLVSYGTTCRFQSPDPAERKKQLDTAKQFVDLAHDTGAIGVKIQPMGFLDGVSREATIQNSAHRCGSWAPTALVKGSKSGWRSTVETLPISLVGVAIVKAAGAQRRCLLEFERFGCHERLREGKRGAIETLDQERPYQRTGGHSLP